MGVCENMITDLIDLPFTGENYVCASSDTFRKVQYGSNVTPTWSVNVRTTSSASLKLNMVSWKNID